MFVDGPNPTQVQLLPPHKRRGSTPPLVLIHDGGGTTFSYFIIGNLRREVWAVHNPKFWDASKWEGGVDEMTSHYVDLIKKAGLKGPIILGGWSLGGFLSLSIARMLAEDATSEITVVGMLIIDSPRHIPRSQVRDSTVGPELSGLPELVKKSFDNCDEMLEDWELPLWDAPTNHGKPISVVLAGKSYTIKPGTVLRKQVAGDWALQTVKQYEFPSPSAEPKAPPPAVLIRCTLPARKSKEAQDSKYPCTVDIFREEPYLGWEGAYPDFIIASIDVEADHYNLFDKFDNVKAKIVTDHILSGLEIIDCVYEPKKVAAMQYM